MSITVKRWDETGLQFVTTKGNRKATRNIVLHHTGGEGGGQQVFRTLVSRNLSVHFLIDHDGTIYQYADAHARLVHANSQNDYSVGIEIVNQGIPVGAPNSKWPREIYSEYLHGRTYKALRFFPAQIAAAQALTKVLCNAYSLPYDVPRDSSGKLITTVLTPDQLTNFRGMIGHYHITRDKIDPGSELLNTLCSSPLVG